MMSYHCLLLVICGHSEPATIVASPLDLSYMYGSPILAILLVPLQVYDAVPRLFGIVDGLFPSSTTFWVVGNTSC
jgi:hypothetical protein